MHFDEDDENKISDFVTLLYFSFVHAANFFQKKIDFVPKADFNILRRLIEKTTLIEGNDDKEVQLFEKMGDFDELEFPVLNADFVSLTEKLEEKGGCKSIESDSDSFILLDDDF